MISLAAVGADWAHAILPAASRLSQLASGNLVAAVWQGVLLAVTVALGLRLLPRTPAAVRFAIWFAVFAIVALLPMAPAWSGSISAPYPIAHPWLTLGAGWGLAIASVWLVASLVRAVTLAAAALRVRSLWKRATPIDLPFAEAGPGARSAQLCASSQVDRPTVIGFFSPKIVIPQWLLEKLTPAELEQIILHEAGHLHRADDWLNLLQKIALVLFPLNPALAWVERRLCFERELAVDERVLQALAGRQGAAQAYASCLATLAEYRLEHRGGFALALGALGRESELARRVGRILRRSEPMRPSHARLLLGAAVLALAVATFGFERCPSLVGFAPSGTPGAIASNLAPVPSGLKVHSGYQAVVMRTKSTKTIGWSTKQNVPHETMLKAETVLKADSRPTRAAALAGFADTRASVRGAHEVVASARVEAPNSTATIPTIVPHLQQQPSQFVEMVVITSWQAADGSRMVLTTASFSGPSRGSGANSTPTPANVAAESSAIDAGPASQGQASDRFHPYAAVPTRDGWLFIQL